MKKRQKLLLSCASLLMSSVAVAQGMHRCYINGQVVQQEARCPERSASSDPKPVADTSKRSVESTSSNPIEHGKSLCKTVAPASQQWKDPTSLLIGNVTGGEMTTLAIGYRVVGVRNFYVPVNGKNSYGAYNGEKTLTCVTSEDGRRVLKVNDVLL